MSFRPGVASVVAAANSKVDGKQTGHTGEGCCGIMPAHAAQSASMRVLRLTYPPQRDGARSILCCPCLMQMPTAAF